MFLRPMLQVADVGAASDWYQRSLGLRSGHGGDEYEMLFDGDDHVLQLHRLDAHEHGILQANVEAPRGAGVSLWFECADVDRLRSLVERARAADANVVKEADWNPLAGHWEATLADLDGYVIVVHSPYDPESAPTA